MTISILLLMFSALYGTKADMPGGPVDPVDYDQQQMAQQQQPQNSASTPLSQSLLNALPPGVPLPPPLERLYRTWK